MTGAPPIDGAPVTPGEASAAGAAAGGMPVQGPSAFDGKRLNALKGRAYVDPDGHVIRRCDYPGGCEEWAGFGFGVSLRAGRLGLWFCGAHAELFRAAQAREAAGHKPAEPGVAPRVLPPPSQGRLL